MRQGLRNVPEIVLKCNSERFATAYAKMELNEIHFGKCVNRITERLRTVQSESGIRAQIEFLA